MAKSTKNTLADLNSFLKQKQVEATESPAAESNPDDFINQKPATLVKVTRVEDLKESNEPKGSLDVEAIVQQIKALAGNQNEQVRKILYKVIQQVLSPAENANASDIMLLNMVHYLHHTENMAEGIDAYIEGMKK